MPMNYEELVKALREATGWQNASVHYSLMKQAADAIEELQQKWIPVTERLPLLMTPVLITDGIEVDIAWMFGVPARWAAQYTDMDADSITHWMELPQTPKEEQT